MEDVSLCPNHGLAIKIPGVLHRRDSERNAGQCCCHVGSCSCISGFRNPLRFRYGRKNRLEKLRSPSPTLHNEDIQAGQILATIVLFTDSFKYDGVILFPLHLCRLDLLAPHWFKYSFEFCPCQRD